MAYKPQHRKDFVLGHTHLFIQQPDEWITNLMEIGQEVRPFPDAAYDWDNTILVPVEDAPEFMDQICNHVELPRYTDLLEVRNALEHVIERLNGPWYSSGVSKGAILRELRMALKGEQVNG